MNPDETPKTLKINQLGQNMPLSHWIVIATLAALPLSIGAQENSRRADPAAPAQAVSAPVYKSAFSDYQASSEFKNSPDKIWRTVNDELGNSVKHATDSQEESVAHNPPPDPNSIRHGAHQQPEGK